MSAFLMPSLGADMEAGTLIEQLVPTGGDVHRGDIIAVVETQKGAIEIEVFQDGQLEDWLVGVGQKVPVGTPLAMIRAAGEPEAPQPQDPTPKPPAPEVPPPTEPGPALPEPEMPPPDIPSPEQPYPELRRLRASPAARRLAARRGIDLSRLPPRRDGTVRLADVNAAAGVPPAPDMRQAIAAAMARSKREIPHYYLSHQLDVTAVLDFVAQRNADRTPEARLVPAALYLRAMARALDKYPEFAGHYIDGRFRPAGGAHIGLAINLRGRGLVAPAIFDVDRSDVDTVMAAVLDLVQRARAGRFRARELSDATITLTSLGERGVDGLFGIIYPPQVAIVGIGTPAPRPCVVAGQVVPRTMATLTLAADHRVSDGHRGALFLRAIDTHLQRPEAL